MNTDKIEEFCRRDEDVVAKDKSRKFARCLEINYRQKLEIVALTKRLAAKEKAIKKLLKPREIEGFNCRGMGARS